MLFSAFYIKLQCICRKTKATNKKKVAIEGIMDILRPPSIYNKTDEFEFRFPPEGTIYF